MTTHNPTLRWAIALSLACHAAAALVLIAWPVENRLVQVSAVEPESVQMVVLDSAPEAEAESESASAAEPEPSPEPEPPSSEPKTPVIESPNPPPIPPPRRDEKPPRPDKAKVHPHSPQARDHPNHPAASSAPSSGATSPPSGVTKPAEYRLGAGETPAPEYPWSARRRKREGRVLIRLEVDPAGRPLAVSVVESSGDAALDQAAREALTTWRLTPALRAGLPVASTVLVPIRFALDR